MKNVILYFRFILNPLLNVIYHELWIIYLCIVRIVAIITSYSIIYTSSFRMSLEEAFLDMIFEI